MPSAASPPTTHHLTPTTQPRVGRGAEGEAESQPADTLTALVNPGGALLRCLLGDARVAGERQAGFLDQRLEVVQVRARRAVVVVLGDAARQLDPDLLGLYAVGP